MVKIGELINLEKALLELDDKVGVPLMMKVELKRHLNEVGDITSMYFQLQYDFYEKVKDTDKLAEYQLKLWGEDIEFDTSEIDTFLEKWS